MNDERLLPTVHRLIGNEVIRVVGTDGKRMLMPLTALLDSAEQRFATRAGEALQMGRAWEAINALSSRVDVIDARTVEAPDADLLQAVDKMMVRVAQFFDVLESLTVRVAALEKSQPIEDEAIGVLRTDLAKLVDRVTALEAQIKTKKDK